MALPTNLNWKGNIFYLITVTSGSQDGHDGTHVKDWQDSGQSVEQEFGSVKYWGLRGVVLVFDWPTAVEGIDASQLSAAHTGPGN